MNKTQHAARLEAAGRRLEAAKANRDERIRVAHADGMTMREIASVVGVSHQRVAQVIHAGSEEQ